MGLKYVLKVEYVLEMALNWDGAEVCPRDGICPSLGFNGVRMEVVMGVEYVLGMALHGDGAGDSDISDTVLEYVLGMGHNGVGMEVVRWGWR